MPVTVLLGGDSEERELATNYAISLAKRLKTTLTGLCTLPDPAMAFMYITGPEAVLVGTSATRSLSEAQDEMSTTYKQDFDQQTKSESWLKAHYVKQVGAVAYHAVAGGLLADALIMPRGATQSSHPLNPAFEHVLMEAGLPLILAPALPRTSDTCLIAWDGSPLTARAVKLHLPLIASYKKAVIAQNADKLRHPWSRYSADSRAELTRLLHENRLEVIQDELNGNVSESLLSAAEKHDASLIVMGAYGRNRLGELLFGGTTSKLLHSQTGPALALCH